MAGRTSWPFTPLSRGFESFYGFLGGELDHYYHGNEDSFELDFWANQDPDFENICWDGNLCPDSAYTDTIYADYAVERIKSVGEGEEAQPLFLYLSWHNPHEPLEAPKNVVDSFTDTVENSRRRVYAAMVQELDNNVGRVLTALDDACIRNNTFIVFTSDNGGYVCRYLENMSVTLLISFHFLYPPGSFISSMVTTVWALTGRFAALRGLY